MRAAGRDVGASSRCSEACESAVACQRPKLQLTLRYQASERQKLTLKITLPLSCEERSCEELLVAPFLSAYARKYPDAEAIGPFKYFHLCYWDGPRSSMAERFPDHGSLTTQLVSNAKAPQFCLISVSGPARGLRAVSRGRHAISLGLLPPEQEALAAASTPTAASLAAGEHLIELLHDPETPWPAMHALLDEAAASRDASDRTCLACARDARGRTALHLAASRGDVSLCRKLLWRGEAAVWEMDDECETALHAACLAGRALIVQELLRCGRAPVREKNRALMLPLQLACVDEAPGNGSVVRMLVEAGADVNARCWDVTPLMAAASAGHHWAIHTLLELGADTSIVNGASMTALDYARDLQTAELIGEFMSGALLPDDGLRARVEAVREQQRTNGARVSGLRGKVPRKFQSARRMPLEEAFRNLGLADDWVRPFASHGQWYPQIRLAWRRLVLTNHPDKQSPGLEGHDLEQVTAAFTRAMCSFEAIEEFFQEHHAADAGVV